MKSRQATLDGSIRVFAGVDPSAETDDGLEVFRSALAQGADGLSVTVWLTADGVAVVNDEGRVGPRLRRRRIGTVRRSELPSTVCSFDELCALGSATTALSVDFGDPDAFEPVVANARDVGGAAEERLWLRHAEVDVLTEWRHATAANLLQTARLRSMKQSPEQCVALLRERGIDGLSLHHEEWNGGVVAIAHRFERYAFGWGLEHEREMAKVLNSGVDGIYGRQVGRMVAVASQFT